MMNIKVILLKESSGGEVWLLVSTCKSNNKSLRVVRVKDNNSGSL